MAHRVLVVDDDDAMLDMLAARLGKRDYLVRTARSGEDALRVVGSEDVDLVVADLNMPGMDGTELCGRLVQSRPNLPVLVITAFGSLESAVAAIRAGAFDFITKPFELEVLLIALERALRQRSLLEELNRLRREAGAGADLDGVVGQCPAMRRLYELIGRVGPSSASVLVTGESGTGKELVARSLHRASPRAERPFVAINCAAMPESLLESELFGHERGAFTDAKQARQGLVLQADGGTLFLDEIGDMPLGLQPKLLRVLEERRVRPVGGSLERPFDVRVLAATNRDLETAVDEGRFREDLFYRINVVQILVPPLRDRGTDVLLLASEFVRRFAEREGKAVKGIAAPAADKLLAYPFPGNVRELRNCIERAVALAQFDKVTVDDLPEKVRGYEDSHVLVAGTSPSELVSLEEVERRYIARVLGAVSGNRTRAAEILGLDRKTLYRKLKREGPEAEGAG